MEPADVCRIDYWETQRTALGMAPNGSGAVFANAADSTDILLRHRLQTP